MNKLRVLVVAAALLTAACGTTTISGSSVKSVSNAGNVHVDARANAGTDVAAGSEDDLGRANPTLRKNGPPQPPLQPATTQAQPSTLGTDRCSAGYNGSTGVGSRASTPGKQPPLPQCAVE